jgi:hypothetical protein
MKVQNRKTVRKAVKTSMSTSLVGPANVAQACYDYQTGEFDLALPDDDIANVAIYVIVSAGSNRQGSSEDFISPEHTVLLNVHSFVLYEKENEWTEAESEDRIDDMEAGFIEWLTLNEDRRGETNPEWLMARLVTKSDIDSVFLAGIEYRHEAFNLEFQVANYE